MKNCIPTSMPKRTTCLSCPLHSWGSKLSTGGTSIENLVLSNTPTACCIFSSDTVDPRPFGY